MKDQSKRRRAWNEILQRITYHIPNFLTPKEAEELATSIMDKLESLNLLTPEEPGAKTQKEDQPPAQVQKGAAGSKHGKPDPTTRNRGQV